MGRSTRGTGRIGKLTKRLTQALFRIGAAVLETLDRAAPQDGPAGTRTAGQVHELHPYISIARDGTIIVVLDRVEMGQGVATALPTLVAEELEVDIGQIRLEFAPADPRYINTMIGSQATGGSTSVRSSWEKLRRAGATVREMLIAAAAQDWGVPASECRAEGGAVVHRPSGRRLGYGALAARAAQLPIPRSVPLKDPADFRLIGKALPRLDTLDKITGRAVFGTDVKVPGMLVAVVARCPVFGGRLRDFDARRALAVRNVRHVVPIESGVAVVAVDSWSALRGRDALKVRWDEGPYAGLSSARISRMFRAAVQQPAAVARSEGDVDRAFRAPRKKVEATYELPYLAHATPEPMNCTAHVRPDGCDIWVPTQAPDGAQRVAAKITGLPHGAIKVHGTYIGGGFGRRFEQDFVAEAVQISKAVGAPVQVLWTRKDDLQHDFYRPASFHRLRAALDKDGLPLAWTHRIACPSMLARETADGTSGGVDEGAVDGAVDLPYAIPNLRIDYVAQEPWVPIGAWRSVGHSQNAFAVECFIDELAAAANQDPYQLRRELLRNAPRHRAVLDLAARKGDWGDPLPPGRGRGIAFHASFGSLVAMVIEVTVTPEAGVRVGRVVCALDCGMVVNPDIVEAQMEGSVVFGLSAALKGEITIRKGRVVQQDIHDYPALRMHETPPIEVHILPSQEPPGGVGEPGVPPVAPALANAVFAATGKRIRKLPIHAANLRTQAADPPHK